MDHLVAAWCYLCLYECVAECPFCFTVSMETYRKERVTTLPSVNCKRTQLGGRHRVRLYFKYLIFASNVVDASLLGGNAMLALAPS